MKKQAIFNDRKLTSLVDTSLTFTVIQSSGFRKKCMLLQW